MRRFGLPPEPTGAQIHRKYWEFCAIGHALEERGFLQPGKRGLCFGAGREFLPSAFAALGCEILATDRAQQQHWEGQHARARADLFYESIVSRDVFDRQVKFQTADMRNIQGIAPDSYDFLWSSCAFEHLGSLHAGMNFVVNAMQYLRAGGIAVHTTEFNLSSNKKTTARGDNVLYRRRDIEELDRRLRTIRCGLEPFDFFAGCHPFDLDYESSPFFPNEKPHIKLALDGFVCTSILLIAHKAAEQGEGKRPPRVTLLQRAQRSAKRRFSMLRKS